MRTLIGWMLLAIGSCVCAADVYVCKGPNGVMAYQQEPCPKTSQNVAHGTYQREPDAPQIVDPYSQQQPVVHTSGGVVAAGPQPSASPTAQQPVAYQCRAGQRTWVQYSRCPATYVHGVAVDGISGTTDDGQEVQNASGWAQVESPVQQQALDRNQLCAQLGDSGAPIQHSGQSDVYERNVAKRKYCGQ